MKKGLFKIFPILDVNTLLGVIIKTTHHYVYEWLIYGIKYYLHQQYKHLGAELILLTTTKNQQNEDNKVLKTLKTRDIFV